jgi:CRP/FNR family transcriptional regulator, anaerobic regulatory protein
MKYEGGSSERADPLARLQALYPALRSIDVQRLAGAFVTVKPGTVLFDERQPCIGFPLVLEGEVRVSRHSADGRGLELYRVAPGELCLASSACLFRSRPLPAQGVATRATTLLVVPAALFHEWLIQPEFRDFVLGLYADRMADLMALIDAVAFHRLDRRVAAALLGHGSELAISHQQLADVLGTVREMVTRLLRRFENEGWIELSRERIRIRDSAALRRLVEGA